ncbi:MAG TPA: cyclic nucleotide-binding domain-containing protein, partial [Candidatus Limnocylindrales bacterium]|nr:cyclic nucleotide-binding domain-containing protein [Candidatus Limnocylindrales bacterium]
AGQSLLQRTADDETLSRLLGVLEAAYLGAFGLGALAAPGLLALVGTRPAFAVLGLWLPLVTIVLWRSLSSIDRDAAVPGRELQLICGVPMLAILSPAAQERLSRRMVRESVAADAWVIREGEPGTRFYVVDSGEAEVTVEGRELRRLGAGGSFGEIALLRDSPRTASVRAVTALELFSLERTPFLSAVTRLPESRLAAARVVEERLAAG